VVRVPSVEAEDRRRLTRERERLLSERNAHLARIKGLLMLHGVREFRPFLPDWKERLDAVLTADGRRLPAHLKGEIERECRRLWLAKEMLRDVEREIERGIEDEAGAAKRLMRVRGIGPTFASVLEREVFLRDFDNRRQVGSYLGLVSSPWQSGGLRRDQGIARSGNPRARRTAIELAWLWLRQAPALKRVGGLPTNPHSYRRPWPAVQLNQVSVRSPIEPAARPQPRPHRNLQIRVVATWREETNDGAGLFG
jgi:transposase